MHRQASTRTLRSLHLAAWHYVINILLSLSALGFFVTWLISDNNQWLTPCGISAGTLAISAIAFFLLHGKWKCPLCMGKLWLQQGCRKHRKAKRALGLSYRLRAALAVIFMNSYRCPYCGERFSSRKSAR